MRGDHVLPRVPECLVIPCATRLLVLHGLEFIGFATCHGLPGALHHSPHHHRGHNLGRREGGGCISMGSCVCPWRRTSQTVGWSASTTDLQPCSYKDRQYESVPAEKNSRIGLWAIQPRDIGMLPHTTGRGLEAATAADERICWCVIELYPTVNHKPCLKSLCGTLQSIKFSRFCMYFLVEKGYRGGGCSTWPMEDASLAA